MKNLTFIIFTLCLFCIMIVGCSKDNVSEGAEAVLNATMNTPNSDLFDSALIISPDMSQEEKTKIEEQLAEVNANWETLLANYFSPGSFDLFLNSYIRTRFYADDPVPSKLIAMTLVFNDEKREVVNVQVEINGSIQYFTVTFLRNPDGLFYRVEIEE